MCYRFNRSRTLLLFLGAAALAATAASTVHAATEESTATPSVVPDHIVRLPAEWQTKLRDEHALSPETDATRGVPAGFTADLIRFCSLPTVRYLLHWGNRPFPFPPAFYEQTSGSGGSVGAKFLPGGEEWRAKWDARAARTKDEPCSVRGRWPLYERVLNHPEVKYGTVDPTDLKAVGAQRKIQDSADLSAITEEAVAAGLAFAVISSGGNLVLEFTKYPGYYVYLPLRAWANSYQSLSRVIHARRVRDRATERGFTTVTAPMHWYLPGTLLAAADESEPPLDEFTDAVVVSQKHEGGIQPVATDYIHLALTQPGAVREFAHLHSDGLWNIKLENQTVTRSADGRIASLSHNDCEGPGGPPLEAHVSSPDNYYGGVWEMKWCLQGKRTKETDDERKALLVEIMEDPFFVELIAKYTEVGLNLPVLPVKMLRVLAVQTRLSSAALSDDNDKKRAAERRLSSLLKAVREHKQYKDNPEAYRKARAKKLAAHRAAQGSRPTIAQILDRCVSPDPATTAPATSGAGAGAGTE